MSRNTIHFLLNFFLVSLLVVVYSTNSYAQDLLVKMNGDTLPIEVIEIQQDFLVYHKINIDKERVFTTARNKLERIIYENGNEFVFSDEPFIVNGKDVKAIKESYKGEFLYVSSGFFAPSIHREGYELNTALVRKVYENNPEALKLFNDGRSTNIVGHIIGAPSGYILGYQLGSYFSSTSKVNQELLGIGIIGCLISIILNKKGVSDIKKSAEVYNTGIRAKKEMEIGFQSTETGVGLVLSF